MNILIKQFLLFTERQKAKKTLENYTHYMANFLQFVGDINVSDVTVYMIEDYRMWLEKEKTLSDCTVHYHLAALRSFARWCERYDHTFVQADRIELPKYHKKPACFLTTEEMHRLLDSQPVNNLLQARNRALMEFLYSTGLRVGEVYRMDRWDVNLKTHEFTIIGKGNRTRIVFLSDRAEYWMGKYLDMRTDTEKALFIGFTRCSTRLTTVSMEQIVRDHAKKLFDKKVTVHTLRHSFATNLLENGADIKAIQEMLGHENIQTTSLYLHLTNSRLRHIHDVCHS